MKIYLIIVLFTFIACNKKENTNQNTSKMTNTIKTFENEPIYRLKIVSSISYVIKINGVTVASKNQNAGDTRWFLINNSIPTSGNQNIEITLRPSMNNEGTKHLELIKDNSMFELDVELTSWVNGSLKEPSSVFSYKPSSSEISNKKNYSHKDTFNANVPYQLVDWRKGKDLRKMDIDQLQNEVLNSYKKAKTFYENQKGNDYLNLIEKGIFNLAQGGYLTTSKFEALKKEEANFVNEEPTPLEPIEYYVMEISGDGKLVSLRRNDGYNSGEGVLRRRFFDQGQEKIYVDDIAFYMPEGKDSLEVVVYQNLEKSFLP